MDFPTLLAVYRTRLAEKRTAVSELQLGILMVTLPLTAHLTLMLLAERHAFAAKLQSLFPVFVSVFAVGIALAVHAMWELVRAERKIRLLRQELRSAMED